MHKPMLGVEFLNRLDEAIMRHPARKIACPHCGHVTTEFQTASAPDHEPPAELWRF